jgi:hypothetical protein
MSRLRRRTYALAVVLGLAGGCSSAAWDALFPRDPYAEIRPILPSPRDTADTLRQVAVQTALIREVCAR